MDKITFKFNDQDYMMINGQIITTIDNPLYKNNTKQLSKNILCPTLICLFVISFAILFRL